MGITKCGLARLEAVWNGARICRASGVESGIAGLDPGGWIVDGRALEEGEVV